MQTRIKLVRQHNKLSQTAFGERLGVSRDVVNNWEQGRVVPNNMAIQIIASKFGISEQWLRTGEGEMFAARSLDQELAALAESLMKESDESFRKRFIAALLQLPPEFWPELERFVESLRKGGTP